MLRSIGVAAAVLDGGYAGWPGSFESGEVQPVAVSRTPVPWPSSAFLDADELSGLLAGDARSFVVDARGTDRYTGQSEPRDPRAGHIPGAVNVPITAHVDGPRLRDVDELRDVYERAGAYDAEHVVAYCGSGMAACENLLVLESLGIEGRLYTGSWSDWSTDPDRPAATGEDAGRWPAS
jgi:thiosulfate/3-mercaptopyruvate sulfurtransferase